MEGTVLHTHRIKIIGTSLKNQKQKIKLDKHGVYSIKCATASNRNSDEVKEKFQSGWMNTNYPSKPSKRIIPYPTPTRNNSHNEL